MPGLPNFLTLFRIAVIPLVVGLMFIQKSYGDILATLLFVIACITDYLDGYFARAWHQMTTIGRFLDPVADKLLIATLLLMLVGLDRIQGLSLIPALIILCREITVSGLREFLAEMHTKMPVSTLAKWKTTLQMVALGLLIVGDPLPQVMVFQILPLHTLGLLGLWIAAVLTLMTGYDYLKKGLQEMNHADEPR